MRIKLLLIMILPLLLIECQSFSLSDLNRKKSVLFTDTEKVMADETSAAIDFKYGYDPDLEMDYVFKSGNLTEQNISSKSPEMKKVMAKYSTKEILSFYEKAFQMKEIQVWKMNYLRNRKNWTNTTYIEKYMLPVMEQYFAILENNVLPIDPYYTEKLGKRKVYLQKLVDYNQKKELEEKERKLREQRKPGWK